MKSGLPRDSRAIASAASRAAGVRRAGRAPDRAPPRARAPRAALAKLRARRCRGAAVSSRQRTQQGCARRPRCGRRRRAAARAGRAAGAARASSAALSASPHCRSSMESTSRRRSASRASSSRSAREGPPAQLVRVGNRDDAAPRRGDGPTWRSTGNSARQREHVAGQERLDLGVGQRASGSATSASTRLSSALYGTDSCS